MSEPTDDSDSRAIRPVPLRRKAWFYWAFARTTVRFIFAVAFGILFAVVAGAWFIRGDLAAGAALGACSLVVFGMTFVHAVIFRYHIRVGMQRELRRRNCCVHCGYDLRASPLRCPECGKGLPGANVEI